MAVSFEADFFLLGCDPVTATEILQEDVWPLAAAVPFTLYYPATSSREKQQVAQSLHKVCQDAQSLAYYAYFV